MSVINDMCNDYHINDYVCSLDKKQDFTGGASQHQKDMTNIFFVKLLQCSP